MRIWLHLLFVVILTPEILSQNVFSIDDNKTYLNEKEFQVIGLRCSNALISDESTNQLISHLDIYKSYGLNTISVFFMGSRYSNVYGYAEDGTLKEAYARRMSRIIEACDERGMVVLVGVLYWGSSMRNNPNDYYINWTQKEVNKALINTLEWLKQKNYRNVFVDPDNEGMAEREMGYNIDEMICAGKEVVPEIEIGYNGRGYPPPCADLSIHFGFKTQSMPYIETEGTPSEYWGAYSKEQGLDHYINVGIYTETKKQDQLKRTKELLDAGHGYLFASTWLQNVPPNYDLGGTGSPSDPGIRWWLEFVEGYLRK